MTKPFFEQIEDRIVRKEAVDLVLSNLHGYDFIIVILWLDGWSIKDIANHLEWNRKRVYARWQKIKSEARQTLIANGFTYAGKNSKSGIELKPEVGRSLPPSEDGRPASFLFGGNDDGD